VEYFFRFPAISRTPNALFGVKLFWDQYVAWGMEANMYLRRDRSTFEAISSVVGPIRFIRLRRRNRLRQAISLVRARQSNQWSRRPGSPPAEAIIPTYSSDAIARAIHELTEHDARWDRELNSIGAATLEISYETLATEYVETVRKILTFLEVVAPRSLEDKPPLRRQADALTEEWVRRAIADIGDAPGG
jgi:LPS sulfotransferase NodH